MMIKFLLDLSVLAVVLVVNSLVGMQGIRLKLITQHKVNDDNIERCISEYNEFAFYKGSGIYNAVFTQLNHHSDIKNNKQ